jgi:ABC-type antimicrobial peptide transport system permease subunit
MSSHKKKPPIIAQWILKRMSFYEEQFNHLDNFQETYDQIGVAEGFFKAKRWYWSQVMGSLVYYLSFSITWRMAMLMNHLKSTFRNIKRNKAFSLINITGLAMGLASCILIYLWIQDELRFDGFHENSDCIYRLIVDGGKENRNLLTPWVPAPLGPKLKDIYPEIMESVRYDGGFTGWNLKYKDKSFINDRIAFAEANFFNVFTFPFVKGNPDQALCERYSIVITERLADKCFGKDDPMGKMMQMNDTPMKVTGVIKDVPAYSHMQFDYILPIINLEKWIEMDFTDWKRRIMTYLLVRDTADVDEKRLSKKIRNVLPDYYPGTEKNLSLQPLKKIHLFSGHLMDDSNNIYQGNIKNVYIFSLIALLIMIIACINFMNLSTARSANRMKEIGMRKVIGAAKKDIRRQILMESQILAFLSLLVAIFLVYLLLPVINNLSGRAITLDFHHKPGLIYIPVLITILMGFIAGSYPAIFISSFHPGRILKSMGFTRGGARYGLRKILVMVQFVFTILLLICSMVIFHQLSYIKYKDLGFKKEQIVYFPGYGKFWNHYETARTELMRNKNILSMTKSFPPMRTGGGMSEFSWEGKNDEENIYFRCLPVNYDYIETFNMKLISGRPFSRKIASDKSNCLINETAAKMMGLESPVGKRFSYTGNHGHLWGFDNSEGVIIGVVKDFHINSIHHKIPPVVMKFSSRGFFVNVKLMKGKMRSGIQYLEKKWKEFVPGRPFKYYFFQDKIDNLYDAERRIARIFNYFTILAVFIACLGLFGLAAFLASQKIKEIGIRKVLGGSVTRIVWLLLKEYLRGIVLANMFAWPAAYLFMRAWLQNFAYRISLSVWIFILASLATLIFALATVSYQSIKAARLNPVIALKNE